MATGLQALEDLDLANIDKDGKPPVPSRLGSAQTLRDLYAQCVREDQSSAIARVRVQAMKDGEPPYNQAALIASGQGSRANANFLMGQDLIGKTSNGYNDIVVSAKDLVTIELDGTDELNDRAHYQRIISTELSRTIRKWPSFIPNFLRLVDLFVTHGIGVSYFPDARDFRFEVCGMGEFLIPRQTPASEEKIPYAIARKDMLVTDLYESVRDEEKATKLGWNVPAVHDAIRRATTASSTGDIGEIEMFQRQIKNHDLHASRKFQHVAVLHGWILEFDDTWSFVIVEKDNPNGDFLFKEYSRFKTVAEAFTFFCYGIGNGTFHSVRGLGNMIYALVQLHNRIMCQAADGEMLDASLLVQATSGSALQEAFINYMGPFSLLSPGLELIDRKFSTRTGSSLSFLGEVKSLMGQFANRFTAPEQPAGQAYQNKLGIEAKLEQITSGDSGSVDLYYCAHDRLMREVVRRIITGPKSDKLVAEFHRRCERAGVTADILAKVDHDSTSAFRAFGAGSPAARSLGFKRMLELLPQLNEVGRKRLIYEFVADVVGYQNADYFADLPENATFNGQLKIAELENVLLLQGNKISVDPNELHATHSEAHIPALIQIIDGIETGEVDPIQSLPGLQAALEHLSAHGEQIAQDPTQEPLYGQIKEVVNNMQMIVTNMDRKLKAEQRKGMEEGGEMAPAEGQQDTAAMIEQTKLEMIQFKADLARQKGELELAIMQAKADQNLALNDMKSAETIKKNIAFPRSDYSQRR